MDAAPIEHSLEPIPIGLAAAFRDHFGFVYATLRRLGLAPDEAEDAAQEVFLVVARRIDDFEGRSTMRTWLYAIARKVATRAHRTRGRRERRLAALAVHPREQAGGGGITATESALVLQHFLQRLAPERREVFVLAELEGMSGPEIAEALGLNLRTAYSRIRAARESLDAELVRIAAREDRVLSRRRWISAAQQADTPPDGASRRVLALLVLRIGDHGAPIGVATATGSGWLEGAAMKVALVVCGAIGGGLATRWVSDATMHEPVAVPSRALADARVGPLEIATPVVPATLPPLPAPAIVAVKDGAPVQVPVRSVASTSPSEPETLDALRREQVLVERAHGLLDDGDAEGVLAQLAAVDRELGVGRLPSERRTLRIRALCRLGKVAQARGEAAMWLRREPGSLHARAAQDLCPP